MNYQILNNDKVNTTVQNMAKAFIIISFSYLCYFQNWTGFYLILGLFIASALFSLVRVRVQLKFSNIILLSLISLIIGIIYMYNRQEGFYSFIPLLILIISSFYVSKTPTLQFADQIQLKKKQN